jgi:hypothetical protein
MCNPIGPNLIGPNLIGPNLIGPNLIRPNLIGPSRRPSARLVCLPARPGAATVGVAGPQFWLGWYWQ